MQPDFGEPITIDTSPSTAAFRDSLTSLFSHLDSDYLTERGYRFWQPLVNWDGVNRLGERKFVSFMPKDAQDQVVSSADIIFPDSIPTRYNLSALLTRSRIKLTTCPERAEDEVFVGSAHEFLNYFQSACKATEDCFTPLQIATAAKGAQNELARDAAKLKRRMHTRNLQDYQVKLYKTFLAVLSNLRYSAY